MKEITLRMFLYHKLVALNVEFEFKPLDISSESSVNMYISHIGWYIDFTWRLAVMKSAD